MITPNVWSLYISKLQRYRFCNLWCFPDGKQRCQCVLPACGGHGASLCQPFCQLQGLSWVWFWGSDEAWALNPYILPENILSSKIETSWKASIVLMLWSCSATCVRFLPHVKKCPLYYFYCVCVRGKPRNVFKRFQCKPEDTNRLFWCKRPVQKNDIFKPLKIVRSP